MGTADATLVETVPMDRAGVEDAVELDQHNKDVARAVADAPQATVVAEETLEALGLDAALTTSPNVWFVDGEQLREARLRVGLKQRDVAERLGYSRQQVTAWEAGRNRIPLDAYRAFCDLVLSERRVLDGYGLERVVTNMRSWPTIGEI